MKVILVFTYFLLVQLALGAPAAWSFDHGRTGYIIKVGKSRSEYKTMSLFVLPGETLTFNIEKADLPITFDVLVDPQANQTVANLLNYDWQAPANPGMYPLKFLPTTSAAEGELSPANINVFVMHPASEVKQGKLNGYRIGAYPKEAYKGLKVYDPPVGYVEVTKENQDTWVSPHYQLKQFLCKQNQGFPKYVVLQTRLLRKLEFLTEAVNQHGIKTNGFVIMSGYRTPFYNSAIKNKLYSRHQWGGAADIYIDENKNGVMDDLNGDGKITVDDAKVLWDIVESFYKKESYKPMIGGLGLYRANAAHGPFVHVDVRGFRARW